MNSNWFIELKFNGVERQFHRFRIQKSLLNLPPSVNAKIGPQHVALVDQYVLDFEKSIYEEMDPFTMLEEERAYLMKMKDYFSDKCSFLNELISCYASNLTDNEVQIYFYRKMIRLINDLVDEKRVALRTREKVV